MNPIRIIRSWTAAPGFVEVMAKSMFATALIVAVILVLRAMA